MNRHSECFEFESIKNARKFFTFANNYAQYVWKFGKKFGNYEFEKQIVDSMIHYNCQMIAKVQESGFKSFDLKSKLIDERYKELGAPSINHFLLLMMVENYKILHDQDYLSTFQIIKNISKTLKPDEAENLIQNILIFFKKHSNTNKEKLISTIFESYFELSNWVDVKELVIMPFNRTLESSSQILNSILRLFHLVGDIKNIEFTGFDRVIQSPGSKNPIIIPHLSSKNIIAYNNLKLFLSQHCLVNISKTKRNILAQIAFFIAKNSCSNDFNQNSNLLNLLIPIIYESIEMGNKSSDKSADSKYSAANTTIATVFHYVHELMIIFEKFDGTEIRSYLKNIKKFKENSNKISPFDIICYFMTQDKSELLSGQAKNHISNYMFTEKSDRVKINKVLQHFDYLIACDSKYIPQVFSILSDFFCFCQIEGFGIFDLSSTVNDPCSLNAFDCIKKPKTEIFDDILEFLCEKIYMLENQSLSLLSFVYSELSQVFIDCSSGMVFLAQSPYTLLARCKIFVIFVRLTNFMSKCSINDQSTQLTMLEIADRNIEIMISHFEKSDFFADYSQDQTVCLIRSLLRVKSGIDQNMNFVKNFKPKESTLLSSTKSISKNVSESDWSRLSATSQKINTFEKKSQLMKYLLHIEISKLLDTLVTDKLDTKDLDLSSAFKKEIYSCLMHLAPINPGLVIYSAERLRCFYIINAQYGDFKKHFNEIMLKYLNYFVEYPTAVALISRDEVLKATVAKQTQKLALADINPVLALAFFNQDDSHKNIMFQKYAYSILKRASSEELTSIIPQIVQLMQFDKHGYLKKLLSGLANRSITFCILFRFNLKSNMNGNSNNDKLFKRLLDQIDESMTKNQRELCARMDEFFSRLTEVSTKMLRDAGNVADREGIGKGLLQDIKKTMPKKIFLPTHPAYVILDIDVNSLRPLKSAAKAPYLIKFTVANLGVNNVEKYCTDPHAELDCTIEVEKKLFIMKAGDDLLQDMLFNQLTSFLLKTCEIHNVDLFAYPYGVVATSFNEGIIECIPNSKSIHELLGENKSMEEVFIGRYGHKNLKEMQDAKYEYIRSLAMALLLMYVFLLRDRHNANLMLDKSGHYLNIDFGFIFGLAPGGKVGTEQEMKLTTLILKVISDTNKANDYDQEYWKMTVKKLFSGFQVLKYYNYYIIELIKSLEGASFGFFTKGSSAPAIEKFFKSFSAIMYSSYQHMTPMEQLKSLLVFTYNHSGTTIYDWFQHITQKTNK